MIERELKNIIQDIAKKMPVVSITGPRQSGKTTLAKIAFQEYKYLNLENIQTREYAENDPVSFLNQDSKGLIIDEVQNVPELFSYIQVIVDEKRNNGMFILTGSNNFLLLEKISQSLAGRVAIFHLFPFSLKELENTKYNQKKYEDYILNGFYPRLYDQELLPEEIYPSYIQTYIERDVRKIININDLRVFQQFIRICAGRIGQLINFSSIGNELGIDHKTIKRWFSILETSFIIYFLHPWHKNFNKRIVKTPKLYFYDTGVASSLLKIKSTEQLDTHFAKGALFENLIINEIIKNNLNQGSTLEIYFWRDNIGNEIDLIISEGNHYKPVEIKSGKTIHESFFKGLKYINKISSSKPENSYLIYGGIEHQKRTDVEIIPWNSLDEL